MSIAVPRERLRAEIEERGSGAYVLTVSDDGSPHAVHAPVAWEGDALVVAVGTRSAANATARAAVSVLFAVRTDDDYSLIVDGTAAVEAGDGGARIVIAPTRAVLHRARKAPEPASECGADCVPLLPGSKRAGG